jgi:hypothetical protein
MRRKFPRRLGALKSFDGREIDAPMFSKRNKTNTAASIASGSPKIRAGAPVPTGFDVRALI